MVFIIFRGRLWTIDGMILVKVASPRSRGVTDNTSASEAENSGSIPDGSICNFLQELKCLILLEDCDEKN